MKSISILLFVLSFVFNANLLADGFVIQEGGPIVLTGTFNTQPHVATPANGRTINFYVTNNGTHNIGISINNIASTVVTVSPGESRLSSFTFGNFDTKVRGIVISRVHGADLDIEFQFTQRP